MIPIPASDPSAKGDARPRSIAANSASLAVAQALVKVLGFAVVFVLTRAVSVEAYGRYAFAAAFTAMFLPLADPGADFHATRMVSRSPERAGEYLGASLVLKTLLLPLLAAVTLGVAYFTGHRGETLWLVVFATTAGWITVACGSYLAVLRALRRMDYEAWFLVVTRVAAFALALAALAMGGGVLGVGAMQVAAIVLGVPLATAFAARSGIAPRFAEWRALARETLAGGVPFAATALLVMVYFRVDVFMVSMWRGERSVGFYGAGTNLMFAVLLASQVLVSALFPVIARAGDLAAPEARAVGRRALTLSLLLSVPFAVGACFTGAPLMRLLYGPAYAVAARSLAYLMGTLPFLFVNNLLGNCLGAVGRQKSVLAIAGASLALNVALNVVLIPRMDYEGAALATLLCEIVGTGLMAWTLRGDFAALLDLRPLAGVAAANLVLAALAAALASRGVPVVAVIAAGAAAYLALVMALRIVRPADLRALAPGASS